MSSCSLAFGSRQLWVITPPIVQCGYRGVSQGRSGINSNFNEASFLKGMFEMSKAKIRERCSLRSSKVRAQTPTDIVQGRYVTASDSHNRWWMTLGDGAGLASKCAYHFCEGLSVDCPVSKKTSLIHIEKFRLVQLKELESKSPAWAFGRACVKEVREYIKWIPADIKVLEKSAKLPWTGDGQEESEESEEDKSSSSSEDVNLKSKMKKLQSELKALEQERKKKKSMKAATKAPKTKKTDGDKATAKDKKRKKKASAGSQSDSPTAGGAKKKKKRKLADKKAKAGKSSSDEDKTKKKRKKKKPRGEKVSSKSSDSDPGLFAGGGPGEESDGSGGKKVDRGPFGTGSAVKFKKASESDSESVFQDAPLKQQASSQLRLVQYAKKNPGRLASRLLLKMQQESARDFRGATQEAAGLTPPAATHYLQTMMLRQMGGKMNLRTLRELKTLCTALDTLAVRRPAQAADIIGQRVKALERATAEGHWSSAQFLEQSEPASWRETSWSIWPRSTCSTRSWRTTIASPTKEERASGKARKARQRKEPEKGAQRARTRRKTSEEGGRPAGRRRYPHPDDGRLEEGTEGLAQGPSQAGRGSLRIVGTTPNIAHAFGVISSSFNLSRSTSRG